MTFWPPDPKQTVVKSAGNPAEATRRRDEKRRETGELDDVRVRAVTVARVQRGPRVNS